MYSSKTPLLQKDFLNDSAVHIGEAMVTTSVSKSEAFMIKSHLVQDRCMDVVDGGRVGDRIRTELIGLTIRCTSLKSATGNKNRVAADMMVATCCIF